jgi:hypothetical protein
MAPWKKPIVFRFDEVERLKEKLFAELEKDWFMKKLGFKS